MLNYKKIQNKDFKILLKACYEKKDNLPNYLLEMHKEVENNPDAFPETIKQRIELEKKFLKKYEFDNEIVVASVMWIHKNIKIVDGPYKGESLRYSLVQKWVLANIIAWKEKDGTNVTKDILLMVASGFGKTTFQSSLNALFLNVPEILGDTQIYLGANTRQQSKLCFDTTNEMLKNTKFRYDFNYRPSSNEIVQKNSNARIRAMSSKGDNFEGIIPSLVSIDEIHPMLTAKYVDNFRKNRTKNPNLIVIEQTTQGDVRGGYLDTKLEVARKTLSGEIKNDSKCYIIFENESIEEVIEAYKTKNRNILRKSNPNIGTENNNQEVVLFEAIKEMIDDPSKRATTLTKNFNIPQNKEQSFFSREECEALSFDENIFYGKPVFFGIDVAYTEQIHGDLTCFTIKYFNPNTNKKYEKDYYFLPKYYLDKDQNKHLMVPDKSQYDGIDYQYFIDRGDVILVDATEITQKYLIDFIMDKMKNLRLKVLKFGYDPNKAEQIALHFNALTKNQQFCIKFLAERKVWNQESINYIKDSRKMKEVYNNNRFTIINYAVAQKKEDSNGYIIIVNPSKTRKDGVSAHLAATSAMLNGWLSQKSKDGKFNIDNLKNMCPENEENYEGEERRI